MMHPITSSMFSHIGYDADSLTLAVRYHPSKKQIAAGEQGDLWDYKPIVPEKWEEMQKAESAGKWFLANIRGKYEGSKVEAPLQPQHLDELDELAAQDDRVPMEEDW